MPLVYNISRGIAISDINGGLRSTGKTELSLPGNWAGDTLLLYLGMISADGKMPANSIYLSEVTGEKGGDSGNTGGGSGNNDPLG